MIPPLSIAENAPPSLSEPYTLTAIVNMPGATIDWIGPDGSVLTSGSGITVGVPLNAGSFIARTLSFINLRSSDNGIYIARTSSGDIARRVIASCKRTTIIESALTITIM